MPVTIQPHIEERLRSDEMVWLTTVRPDGRPHSVPVWFLWDGATVLKTVIDIVLERFPKLVRLTRKQVTFIEDPAVLRYLIVKMGIAQTIEEARQHLLKVDEDAEIQ